MLTNFYFYRVKRCDVCSENYLGDSFEKCKLEKNPEYVVMKSNDFQQLQTTISSHQQSTERLQQQLRDANRVIANFRGQNPEMVFVQENVFRAMMDNAILWQNHVAALPEEVVQERIENGHGVED